MLQRLYRMPIVSLPLDMKLASLGLGRASTEFCFYVETSAALTHLEQTRLKFLLGETYQPDCLSERSFLNDYPTVMEFGPRLGVETAYSTTAVSICAAQGLHKITRLERSRRIGVARSLTSHELTEYRRQLHDRMTEMSYDHPLETFSSACSVAAVRIIPVIENGKDALRDISKELGLSWDEQDIAMYYSLFAGFLKRNPTDVELFYLAQANCDHSRHRFFKGKLVIDGIPNSSTLLDLIKEPWQLRPGNSLLAFCDDSSAIQGKLVTVLAPQAPGCPSEMIEKMILRHLTATAETHNHPCFIAAYEGALTATGGRIRDGQMVGRGGHVIAGGVGYCTANLQIAGYPLPWETGTWANPPQMMAPLDILIQASNGCSDYGNCFGEPVVYGFTRTFAMDPGDGYRSWHKPIVYTVGNGQIDETSLYKQPPAKSMLIILVGGPGYRIGIGGGSASSMCAGDNSADLDFNSVQRGAPEMEQRVNRLIRACVELGENNPIVSGHDLGAGGICNAGPELADPAGATFFLRQIPVGDASLSAREIWGNESQERNIILVWPNRLAEVGLIAKREGVPLAVVGEITGDGQVRLYDIKDDSCSVDLPLDKVLGDLPVKTFELERIKPYRFPLVLPPDLTVREALDRVLRLPAVGSKRFLTTKVDRSVTGQIAQQQCVGPHHITLCDYAVIADSCLSLTGAAVSLGEQPLKGLLSPQAMARLAVAEAILNVVGAKIVSLEEMRYQANWMLAARQPGEGAWLYDAVEALRDICCSHQNAIDGGKDSSSMGALLNSLATGEQVMVKAPGQLVIATYAHMLDITKKVTPDVKHVGDQLIHIDLNGGKRRLGGSALGQVFQQVGNVGPDVDDVQLLARTFNAVQQLVADGQICAVHDVSDGGFIVTLLEMAFAGNAGIDVSVSDKHDHLLSLFAEEPGLVLETDNNDAECVLAALKAQGISAHCVGTVSGVNDSVKIDHNGTTVLNEPMRELRFIWEQTSTTIDRCQANPVCVEEEAQVNRTLAKAPPYTLSFVPEKISPPKDRFRVAILRERGSNGDREMTYAFHLAGFETYDVTMTDLMNGFTLDSFRGLAFVGGFAFADVFDAAKGWAGVILFNEQVRREFDRFYQRPDTFSFGPCNGCQLMALLQVMPGGDIPLVKQPRFVRNKSGRFEQRFPAVQILPSPAIMLREMEGSILGVWSAHGEGRFLAPDQAVFDDIVAGGLAPLRYVDYDGHPTEVYPFNPNGSPLGIAGLCSADGRHLAMMPHPERTFLPWQWPWQPDSWKTFSTSPWHKMFQNAHTWCEQTI